MDPNGGAPKERRCIPRDPSTSHLPMDHETERTDSLTGGSSAADVADQRDSKSLSALAAWMLRAESQGLIGSGSSYGKQAALPVTELGVSISHLVKLANALPSSLRNADVATVVSKLLVPLTAKPPCHKKGRLFDIMPAKATGKPSFYLVYASQTSFTYVIEQLKLYFDERKFNLSMTYVWADWMAVNQHVPAGKKPQTEMGHVKDLVKSCRHGAVVVFDMKLSVLRQAWCLLEAWSFVYHGSLSRLSIVLPEEADAELVNQLEAQLEKLDVSKAECIRNPSDVSKIISEVKATVGMKLFHKLLRDALQIRVHCYFRWSGKLKNIAIYSHVLLQAGEFGQLLTLLHCIPELEDDEETLQEIRSIYASFDTDGSGGLDEDEFSQVLMVAGFEEAEARRIFAEVDADGGGSVDLEEFENWWLSTQRQQTKTDKRRKMVSLTPSSLQSSLEKLAKLCQRQEQEEAAAAAKHFAAQIKSGAVLKGVDELSPGTLRGDWKAQCDECSWKLHCGDAKAASKIIYHMLVWNGDKMDVNPDTLVDPDTLSSSGDMCKELSGLLSMFASLLKAHGVQRQHVDIFNEIIKGLASPHQVAVLLKNMNDKDGKQHSMADGERFKIVRGMVAMKYGEETPLSRPLIAEAEKSLGMWMASTKAKGTDSLYNPYIASSKVTAWDAAESGNKAKTGSMFKRSKGLQRDIPAEGDGPIVSLLNDLGPDAQAFLAELQAKEEADSSLPQDGVKVDEGSHAVTAAAVNAEDADASDAADAAGANGDEDSANDADADADPPAPAADGDVDAAAVLDEEMLACVDAALRGDSPSKVAARASPGRASSRGSSGLPTPRGSPSRSSHQPHALRASFMRAHKAEAAYEEEEDGLVKSAHMMHSIGSFKQIAGSLQRIPISSLRLESSIPSDLSLSRSVSQPRTPPQEGRPGGSDSSPASQLPTPRKPVSRQRSVLDFQGRVWGYQPMPLSTHPPSSDGPHSSLCGEEDAIAPMSDAYWPGSSSKLIARHRQRIDSPASAPLEESASMSSLDDIMKVNESRKSTLMRSRSRAKGASANTGSEEMGPLSQSLAMSGDDAKLRVPQIQSPARSRIYGSALMASASESSLQSNSPHIVPHPPVGPRPSVSSKPGSSLLPPRSQTLQSRGAAAGAGVGAVAAAPAGTQAALTRANVSFMIGSPCRLRPCNGAKESASAALPGSCLSPRGRCRSDYGSPDDGGLQSMASKSSARRSSLTMILGLRGDPSHLSSGLSPRSPRLLPKISGGPT